MVCMFVSELVGGLERNKEKRAVDQNMPRWKHPWHFTIFQSVSKVKTGCDTSFVSTDIYFLDLDFLVLNLGTFLVGVDLRI